MSTKCDVMSVERQRIVYKMWDIRLLNVKKNPLIVNETGIIYLTKNDYYLMYID